MGENALALIIPTLGPSSHPDCRAIAPPSADRDAGRKKVNGLIAAFAQSLRKARLQSSSKFPLAGGCNWNTHLRQRVGSLELPLAHFRRIMCMNYGFGRATKLPLGEPRYSYEKCTSTIVYLAVRPPRCGSSRCGWAV
jgi:hypothetical protein